MHIVSDLYRSIYSGHHWKEIMVLVNGVEYHADSIVNLSPIRPLYAGNKPMIGSCVAGEIDISYFPGAHTPPRMAKIEPFVRVTNGNSVSEWIPKGVFYSDTRTIDSETGMYTIHGYDSMLKSEQPFLSDGDVGTWPRSSPVIVDQIATKMGVSVDQRTVLRDSVMVPYPNDLTCRELLSQIAVAHAGNWVMSDGDQLLLIGLNSIPTETNLMVDEIGDVIKFGEVAILVG